MSDESKETEFIGDVEIELVGRRCTLTQTYKRTKLPSFKEKTNVVCFVSPDCSFAVIREALATATNEVFIAIYDFTARYIKKLLENVLKKGVKVKLMIDYDYRKGESEIIDDLINEGVEVVKAPSCGNAAIRIFPSCHQKVIIIDRKSVIVESCNWTEHSVPENEYEPNSNRFDIRKFKAGNREWGVWIKNRNIAKAFYDVMTRDFNSSRFAPEELTEELPITTDLFERMPARSPPNLFSSGRFNISELRVQPVLTPDNYFEKVRIILDGAKDSIFIQQQYIRPNSNSVAQLLNTIKANKNQNKQLDIRMIISPKVYSQKQKTDLVNDVRGLQTFGFKLGKNIRFLNLNHFVHCHNKGILVDDRIVMVGSQNWSEAGVGEWRANREAGLLIHNDKISRYFSQIFKDDWENGLKQIADIQIVDLTTDSIPGYSKASIGDHLAV